tara:strand:- start:158 stop:688 length:531 start_codon:yes stop_codon:yes gene_type:complete
LNTKTLKQFFLTRNLPNLITIFRILLIFPIIVFLEIDFKSFVYFFIIIGGISDFADGFIAKKYNLKTSLGATLDPLADKIFILILFTWLCINQIIPFWSFSIIILREFFITSIRNSNSHGMPAISIAKYKSFFQFLALLMLFYPYENMIIFDIGKIFYWISFLLCIYSSIIYLRFK